jgi:hypothetical protein
MRIPPLLVTLGLCRTGMSAAWSPSYERCTVTMGLGRRIGNPGKQLCDPRVRGLASARSGGYSYSIGTY